MTLLVAWWSLSVQRSIFGRMLLLVQEHADGNPCYLLYVVASLMLVYSSTVPSTIVIVHRAALRWGQAAWQGAGLFMRRS